LITTDSEGKYSVEWMPSATGGHIVKALWAGNSSYPRTEVTANLAERVSVLEDLGFCILSLA